MDGKGRWVDNIIMERFWRTYKHEFFLHREPKSLEEAIEMTSKWMEYYNRESPHSSLKNCSLLMYRENNACPLPADFFWGAIFPLRHGSPHFASRPRCARDSMSTLQNRTKNGLTSEGIERYKNYTRQMYTSEGAEISFLSVERRQRKFFSVKSLALVLSLG